MSSDICYTWHCAITIWCGKYVCSSDEELYVKSHHCVLTLTPLHANTCILRFIQKQKSEEKNYSRNIIPMDSNTKMYKMYFRTDPLLIVLHIKSNSNWKIQFSVFNICEFDRLLFSGWIWTIFCVNHCLAWRHSDHKSPIFTNGPIQCWPPNCFRLFTFNMQDKNKLENTHC